jgi:hypothetical protein
MKSFSLVVKGWKMKESGSNYNSKICTQVDDNAC